MAIINNKGIISRIIIDHPVGKSDHATILFKVHCAYEYEKQQTKKIYQQANWDQMREEIDLDCDEMLKDQNTSLFVVW